MWSNSRHSFWICFQFLRTARLNLFSANSAFTNGVTERDGTPLDSALILLCQNIMEKKCNCFSAASRGFCFHQMSFSAGIFLTDDLFIWEAGRSGKEETGRLVCGVGVRKTLPPFSLYLLRNSLYVMFPSPSISSESQSVSNWKVKLDRFKRMKRKNIAI